MSWITPLGFLGLISIAILILIYILKPNYQQKIISTTFVWKLSLKYKKKKIPVSKLRNLLIFLCQLFILTAASLMLAQPFIQSDDLGSSEKILIIDASASMLTETDGETRFERAVEKAQKLAEEVTSQEGGRVTVILAGDEASFLVGERLNVESFTALSLALDDLIVDPTALACTYSEGDIEGAVAMAEDILVENNEAEIILYTGTRYFDKKRIQVVDVALTTEWNAAILDCKAEIVENYFTFTVDVACYNASMDLPVVMELSCVNRTQDSLTLQGNAICSSDDEVVKVVFDAAYYESNGVLPVYSYESARVYFQGVEDSYSYDDTFYLYGGVKQTIRIQYASPLPNDFVGGILMDLRDGLRNSWDIELVELKPGVEPALEGFDMYVFEHKMPETMPTDGIVIMLNPDSAPAGSGFGIDQSYAYRGDFSFTPGDSHEVMKYLNVENIKATEYRKINVYDGYVPVMYCGSDPVFLVKNELNAKVAILSFSLKMSDLSVRKEFPILFYNLFKFYLPPTLDDYVYEINETVTLNARGAYLNLSGADINNEVIDTFPATRTFSQPGVYTVWQTLVSGAQVVENFYVRIPVSQSDIFREVDELPNIYVEKVDKNKDRDLLVYFAIAMVALLFAEWWLHSKELF